MENEKYELYESIEVDGHQLHRIIALRDFNDVRRGDKGGLIEDESMLDTQDDSWVYGNSMVYGEDSLITGDSEVYDNSIVESSQIIDSIVRNSSQVVDSCVQDSYVHKSSQVHDSTIYDAYLSHDTQVRKSEIKKTSLEASYVQDAQLIGCDESHIVQINDNLTRMEMIDSVELSNYDETNIHEYIEKYEAEEIELSDDDLSDLNEQTSTIQQ